MPNFRRFVEKQIREIESWPGLPSDEADWQQLAEDCRSLLYEVERAAMAAGVPHAVEACQVRGNSTSIKKTRQILAKCLAASRADGKATGAKSETATNGAMSVAEVAEQLGVSKSTVYTMCREGRMPCTRIGGRITISPVQLRSFQSELPKSGGSLRHLS
jgi:excisionase family DNA binding protein